MTTPFKFILLLFISLTIGSCKDDDNTDPPASNGPPSNYTTTFDADISGFITEDFDFSHANTDSTTNILTFGFNESNGTIGMTAAEPGMNQSLGIVANAQTYTGVGEYISDGTSGYGSYSTEIGSEVLQFIGVSSSITITESQLIQEVVNQTYLISGSFEMMAIEPGGSGDDIEVSGTFSNAVISVAE